MKRSLSFILLLCLPGAIICAQKHFSVVVSNPLTTARTDQPVVISLAGHADVRSALVTCNGQEVPCQLDDLDEDDRFDELCFLADLEPKERKTYAVELFAEGIPRSYPARVYAEMLMRNDKVKQKNKHDNYVASLSVRGDCANSYNLLHHHGVSFESELNGIRIYFDKRQTPDLYGKRHRRLELQATQFYTSDEQKAQGYGDDVLWVGNTFGLGALRGWNGQAPTMVEPVKTRTQRVVAYGPLRTIVEIEDRGWVVDQRLPPLNMTLRYTQYAGHRDTDVDIFFNRDAAAYRFATGIINVKNSVEFSDHRGLRACWGTDYPSTDTLKWKPETVGLAILIPQRHIVSEEHANTDNYAFVVGTDNRHMSYKICYCSANEDFGFVSSTEWFEWLKLWRHEVEHPAVWMVK